MLRILIAPNSFKECADSVTISGYIESDLRRLLREKYKTSFTPIVRPISDGGDGFLEVCREIFNLKILQYKISSPWDETPVNCQVGYSKDRGIIFIESANVLGMKIIPKERRNPLLLSSKGMGELLLQLKEDKAKGELSFGKVVVGIGGTGISDFGIGMCSVLGLKLFSSSSEELVPIAQNFSETSKIVWQKPELPYEIEVILDVDNPLLGDNGACRVFSRQKGATDAQVELLESGISKLVNLLREEFPDNNNKPLYGAGGGLAAAFSYLLDAESKFARDFIRKDLSINKNLKADLVITGEGTFDFQSYLKKGVMIIIDEFSEKNIPVYLCAGNIQKNRELENLKNVHIINISDYFSSKDESIRRIKDGIKFAVEDILNSHFSKKISS